MPGQPQTPNSRTRASQLLDDHDDKNDDVNDGPDGEDDEETLQLKLAAIEARLKLKKLQQGKAKSQSSSSDPRPNSADSSRAPPKSPSAHLRSGYASSPKISSTEQDAVQVQLSPVKKPERPPSTASPTRVKLGIDKGVRGNDVSLKWQRGGSEGKTGGFRNRNDATARGGITRSGQATQSAIGDASRKPESFSDRVLEKRSEDRAKREKAQNLQRKRNAGFAVDRREIENFQAAASAAEARESSTPTPASNRRQRAEFSRDDVMNAYHQPDSKIRQKKSVHSKENRSNGLHSGTQEFHSQGQTHRRSNSVPHASEHPNNLNVEETERTPEKIPDPSKFEAYSGLHLSKRILPHSFIKRTLATATSMRIPNLLRTVKPSSFDPPETEGDYVVFGIVASKSSPRDHKEKQNATPKEKDPYDDGSNNTSKYMVLTLTDLKWSVDLFLFATAFPRYYKLTPGTLIAILNPSIMPPPPHKIDTNAFSLTVSSSDDTILEIGTAIDIGFCKSVKKDGKVCESWVDARKTEFCDFHVDLQLKKTKAQRMGVNSGTGILGDRGGRGGGNRGGRFGNRGGGDVVHHGLKDEGGVYDRATGSTYYVAPSVGRGMNPSGFGQRSAAGLIDADDPFTSAGGLQRGGSKDERFRKRAVEQQREREIGKRLGELKSVGSEYLRAHNLNTASSSDSHANRDSTTDAQSSSHAALLSARETLGLDNLSKNAKDIKLGRSKKRNLEPDKDTPKSANTGKKTRFVTPKGIREAGRDSLGDTTMTTAYDDDLDIV